MEHKLKILSRYYEAILQGKKTFEVRKDDRPFQEGDTLLLEECVTPDGCGYTGREMKVDVTYILRDSKYVKDGYCIMGIKILSTNKSRYYNNTPSRRAVIGPTTDVQPWKQGKWIDCTFYDPCEKSWEQEYEFKCSNCGYKIYNKPSDNNLFCGHCGARMDGNTKNTIATMIGKEVEEHE